jgi:hypothetical protein
MRNAYKILVRKSEWKRPLSKSKGRWEDNIKIDHEVIGYEGVESIILAKDRSIER